jgi:ubiquinone/menaquinone biosynthesis C-methylase UbiE
MHSFAQHRPVPNQTQPGETRGLVLNMGWRYDLMLWWANLRSHGKWQALQQKSVDLANFQAGEKVLDVGCGTGTFSLQARARVGTTGSVSGIDPGPRQIARARAKAARYGQTIDFRVGMIEHLPFPDQSFDVVLSTFMMHVLPDELKSQGLSEIIRVLKPGGRLLIVDFKRPEEPEHQSQPARPVHTGPWNSGVQDQSQFLRETGFSQIESGEIETGEVRLPEVGFASGRKNLV